MPNPTDTLGYGQVGRSLPTPRPDGTYIPNRVTRYGGQLVESVFSTKHPLADEGSYFVATNPTPGTAVAYALQTAFSDTAALFAIQNTATPGDQRSKRVYLDYLRLMLTAAPTATVSMQFAVKIDSKDRTPTAGNVAITPVNVNMDDSTKSVSLVQAFSAAALTVPASTASARLASRFSVPTSLGIVGDEYLVQFAGTDHGGSIPGLTATRATAVGKFNNTAAPIVIGPGQWAIIYMWWLTAATAAPSFEYELGLIER